jgi:glycosyltransferase involved in cell wall biosynthesis
LHVCVFTSVHRPYDVRVFHRECRSLADAGYKITLLAHADFDQEEMFGVRVKGISRPANRFLRLLNSLEFYRSCVKENADVYHFHDFELLLCGFLLKRFNRKKVIYDCHENYPEAVFERAWLPEKLKPILSKIIGFIEPLIARQLDCVVCVVPDQQQRFDKNGCNTVLVRNLPRLELFQQSVDKNLPKENRIIYVGGLTIVRGAKFMVDIMEKLREDHPSVKLLLLGPFNEPYVEKEVKEYIAEKNLTDSIKHINFVPHQKVPEFISLSKVGLIPWQPNQQTLKMVFPNKVFEYMSCGIPTVASDLPSLKYIFEKANSGLVVNSQDAKAHADAIGKLLENVALSQKLGQNGLDFVGATHNWELEALKLLDLYQTFIDAD